MTTSALPLGEHVLLHTRDIDEARDSVARSLCPHSLAPLGSGGGFEARHHAWTLDQVSLHAIDYGSDVEVAVNGTGFELVQIPLAGTSRIRVGRDEATATTRTAVMTPSDSDLRMRYPVRNPRLMVRVPAAVWRDRQAMVGSRVDHGGPTSIDLTAGVGRSWRQLVDYVIADVDDDHGLSRSHLAARSLATALVDGLVQALSPEVDAATRAATPGVVRRATRHLEEWCHEPLRTADVADAVGVSSRALQSGFRLHLGTTPMAYLREVRLRRLRAELLSDPTTSVTDAAVRWGVPHLGRLAGEYRRLFGETPSQTLRRAR